MKKALVNALVDLAAMVSFIPSLVSGIVLFLVPEGGGYRGGTGSGATQIYLGLTRWDWRFIHDYTSLILAVLIFAHLLLHLSHFRNIRRILRVTDGK
jgi:hypothetical protein